MDSDNQLVKLKVPDLFKARIWLEWCKIDFVMREDEIFINKNDWEKANTEFDPPQSPKPPRSPDTYKGGRPTLASQGLHTQKRISVSISKEANDHIKNCQRDAENKSQVTDRVILEHKTMIDIAEKAE